MLSAVITVDASAPGIPSLGTSLSQRIANQCSVECVKVAQEVIDLVYEHRTPSSATAERLAAWWFNVLFVYSAATILIAANLCPFLSLELTSESMTESWHRASNILEGYQAYSESIPKLITSLQLIQLKIPEKFSQLKQGDPKVNEDSTQKQTASQTFIGRAQHLAVQYGRPDSAQRAHPESMGSMPMLDDLQELHTGDTPIGQGDMNEMADLDFYLSPNDMSWLNSVPFDIDSY